MKKRMLSLLLCLCVAAGLFTGLTATAAAAEATDIQTAGKTHISVGESTTWTAKALPEGAQASFQWTAGNPGVATVDQNGRITGHKAGQCHITVRASSTVKKTVLLTVGDVAVTGINTAGKTKLVVGESVTWKATVLPANATNKNITWTAGNPGVATIDRNGRIVPKKEGQCHITATAANGVKKTVLLTVQAGTPLYTQDGRVIEVPASEVEKSLKAGWSKAPSRLPEQEWGYDGDAFWTYGNGCLYVYRWDGAAPEPVPSLLLHECENRHNVYNLYISRGFNALAYRAFDGIGVSRMEIPDTVMSIGMWAISGANLKRIGIPKSVVTLEGDSFTSLSADITIFGETGSRAESFAKEHNLKFVPATCVYYPDGRTMMVSDAERPVYLRHGWYEKPDTEIKLAGKTKINVGDTVTWTASIAPAPTMNKKLTWTAGNPAVATVDQNGRITARKNGQCDILVSDGYGLRKSVPVTVGSDAVTAISFDGVTQIYVGESTCWDPIITPSYAANKKLTWTAGNPGVATVDQNGRITGHKAGKCNITATAANGVKKTVMITVKEIPVENLAVLIPRGDMTVGENLGTCVVITPENATNQKVTWSSGNPAVATVDQSGLIHAVRAGKANITATTANGKKVTHLITVYNRQNVRVLSERASSSPGFDIEISWENLSSKTINYIHFYVNVYDLNGSILKDEYSGKSEFEVYQMGPYYPESGDRLYWDDVIYNGRAAEYKISRIMLEYADGTRETIKNPRVDVLI